jgi:hypothetical protein
MNIHIPTPLRAYTGGKQTVNVPGATIADALTSLVGAYPELQQNLYTTSAICPRRKPHRPAKTTSSQSFRRLLAGVACNGLCGVREFVTVLDLPGQICNWT